MVVIAGCSGGGDAAAPEEGGLGGEYLTPEWEPEIEDGVGAPADPADDASASPAEGAEQAPTDGGLRRAAEPPADPATPAAPADDGRPPEETFPTSASVTDSEGDVSGPALERPPAWVDLLGATLSRGVEQWELRIRVAGGVAPASSGSEEHTMNLAFFADLDGDGSVDGQIWANLADRGWGTGWFPPEPPNRFDDESEVELTTEGDEVVLRFPASHLPVEHLRWSLASEWGRYATLGTDATARDRAPDTGPAHFP